jgi:hypothetical protein
MTKARLKLMDGEGTLLGSIGNVNPDAESAGMADFIEALNGLSQALIAYASLVTERVVYAFEDGE